MPQPGDTLGVLASVEKTVPLWEHVRVDPERLERVCNGIAPVGLALPAWDEPVFARADPAMLAGQILLFNSINFCYWGDPKWAMAYQGQMWDGSFGLLMALQRAVDDGVPILEGTYLAHITAAEFRHILRGQGELHLLAERLAIWHEVGRVLAGEFAGRFPNMIAVAQGDALALVRLLIERMPSFDDRATLAGHEVRFYKRAQLAAAMLYEAFRGQGWGQLDRIEHLTAFADYKLPQVLRRLGILVYDASLAAAVDKQAMIPPGERCEVEMRAATIWAVELMRRELAPRHPGLMALHLDYWLWAAGQEQGSNSQPYHRTLTTAY